MFVEVKVEAMEKDSSLEEDLEMLMDELYENEAEAALPESESKKQKLNDEEGQVVKPETGKTEEEIQKEEGKKRDKEARAYYYKQMANRPPITLRMACLSIPPDPWELMQRKQQHILNSTSSAAGSDQDREDKEGQLDMKGQESQEPAAAAAAAASETKDGDEAIEGKEKDQDQAKEANETNETEEEKETKVTQATEGPPEMNNTVPAANTATITAAAHTAKESKDMDTSGVAESSSMKVASSETMTPPNTEDTVDTAANTSTGKLETTVTETNETTTTSHADSAAIAKESAASVDIDTETETTAVAAERNAAEAAATMTPTPTQAEAEEETQEPEQANNKSANKPVTTQSEATSEAAAPAPAEDAPESEAMKAKEADEHSAPQDSRDQQHEFAQKPRETQETQEIADDDESQQIEEIASESGSVRGNEDVNGKHRDREVRQAEQSVYYLEYCDRVLKTLQPEDRWAFGPNDLEKFYAFVQQQAEASAEIALRKLGSNCSPDHSEGEDEDLAVAYPLPPTVDHPEIQFLLKSAAQAGIESKSLEFRV